jgi:hypothetical protein
MELLEEDNIVLFKLYANECIFGTGFTYHYIFNKFLDMGLLELRGSTRITTYITETGKELVLSLPIEQLTSYTERFFYKSVQPKMLPLLYKAMERRALYIFST